MKASFLFIALCFAINTFAQDLEEKNDPFDTVEEVEDNFDGFIEKFDENVLGWGEYAWKDFKCLIMNGTLHMESKIEEAIATSCSAPFSIDDDFELSCEVLVKKIDDDKTFGVIIDVEDYDNYLAFMVTEGIARYEKWKDGKLVGSKLNTIKMKEKKGKSVVVLTLRREGDLVKFYVNDVLALEKKNVHLTISDIGFKIGGKQKIDFDNLKIVY